MTIPALTEINALHTKYAPSQKARDSIFIHCQIVNDICIKLVEHNSMVNRELVTAGALLHDIGAYAFINPDGTFKKNADYVTHGIIGYDLLCYLIWKTRY